MEEDELSSEEASEVGVVAKGGALQILGTFIRRGLNFALVGVAVRILGTAGFGLYRQVVQVLDTASQLGPGGFEYAAVRFVTRSRSRGQAGHTRTIMRVCLLGALTISLVLFGGLIFGAGALAQAFKGADSQEFANLIRIGAAFVPLLALMRVLLYYTQAHKTMVPSIVVGQLTLRGSSVVLSIGAFTVGWGIAGAVGALVASSALALILAWSYYLRMREPSSSPETPPPGIGSIVGFAFPQGGAHLMNIQSLGLGVILLGLTRSDLEVGVFALAVSLQGLGGVFLGGMVNIWAPVVADFFERGQITQLQVLYQTVNRWIATFSFPVFAALMLEGDFFLRILAGQEIGAAVAVTAVLAAGNLFYVGTGPSGLVLSMTGRPAVNLVNSTVAVSLYVGLGLWLVPLYGVLGMAAVDAAITALVNTVRVIQGKIIVGIQPFGRTFLKPVVATLVFVATIIGFRFVPLTQSVAELLGLIVASVAYLLTLGLLGLDAQERYVIRRIRAAAVRAMRRTHR